MPPAAPASTAAKVEIMRSNPAAGACVSPGVWSLTPRQNGQCGRELLAGICFAGDCCAACDALLVVQIVAWISTGAAFASNGHSALNAMPKIANHVTMRRFIWRAL